MKLLQFAKLFDMNVNELADYLGVSRQALYPGFMSKKRVTAVAEQLRVKSEALLMEEHIKTEERFVARGMAIEKFVRNMLRGDTEDA